MKQRATPRYSIGAVVMTLGLLAIFTCATAKEATAIKLTLKNHGFQPAEPHAPANTPLTIEITNLDATPAEFESMTLRVERIVVGGATISLKMRPLAPGRYHFFDDYHEDTTEGFLIVK